MPALDAYTMRARVIPVLVVALPALILLGSGVISGTRLGIAAGATTTVLAALAGQLGRDRGKALEPALWSGWGGPPTVQALRLREVSDVAVVERLHARIARVVDEPLPSVEAELSDSASADRAYNRVSRRLIALTRDHARFPLILAENINYGQRRNLLGLRPIGIALATTTLSVAAVLFVLTGDTASIRAGRFAPGAVAGTLALMFWLAVVTPAWVRVPAGAYAQRLLEAVDVLSPQTSTVDALPASPLHNQAGHGPENGSR